MTEQTRHTRAGQAPGGQAQLEQTRLASSLYHLGQGLMQQERWREAREAIELSLSFAPSFPQGHFDLGNLLHSEGRNSDAAGAYRRAVDLEPGFAEAWYNLGVVLMIGQKFDESAFAYRHAVEIKPDYPEAHNNLGILLQSQGQAKAAAEHYRAAARLNPEFASAYYNLALTLQQQGELEQSLEVYQDLFASMPTATDKAAAKNNGLAHVDARNNRANVLLEVGDYTSARDAYREVLALDPKHPEANWNLGLVQLQLGKWAEGWKQYEWRFKQPGRKLEHRSRPRWDGRPLNGRRILLHAEQGLGDAIQFVRFAPQVAACGGRVWIECHAPLVPLFERLDFVEGVSVKGSQPPDFDFHAPVMSLPFILGLNDPAATPNEPYLRPETSLVASYRERLLAYAKPWIGITWSGNTSLSTNGRRSLNSDQVLDLRDGMPGTWVSLQRAVPPIPAAGFTEIEDPDATTMDHAAAVIANLDLLITVDTSMAHLAGALGRPVWTLLAHSSDWRWMTGTESSIWYPSMKLLRQHRRGEWQAVINAARRGLETEFAPKTTLTI